MYCPNCGQQQVSDEMRFCSRCGLGLSGLAEWLGGSRLPARPRDEAQTPAALSPRRKLIRRAAKLMFFSGVLLPIFIAFSIAVDDPGPLVIPIIVFFVSLVLMLYARLFSDKTVPAQAISQAAQTSTLGSNPARGSLPPAANIPIPRSQQHVRTNELAQPPSVTENTTRLLDNE